MYYREQSGMNLGPFHTSKKELEDIAKAWIAISIAFSFLLGASSLGSFLTMFAMSLVTVGLGFLLHELAHKVVAQRYGCFAEFRSFDSMLVVAIVVAFLARIVIAAPGAVMISGPVGNSRNGKISVAGPLTNLVIALLFMFGYFIYPSALLGLGFLVNTWLGLFNLIPVWNLDGKKILNWSRPVYFLMLAIGIVFFITGSLLGVSV